MSDDIATDSGDGPLIRRFLMPGTDIMVPTVDIGLVQLRMDGERFIETMVVDPSEPNMGHLYVYPRLDNLNHAELWDTGSEPPNEAGRYVSDFALLVWLFAMLLAGIASFLLWLWSLLRP
jgi:hypothetical protein